MPSPVIAAITMATPPPISRRTGSTGSRSGWPLIRIGLVSSASLDGLNSRNDPYNTAKVAAKNAAKISA